MIKLTFADRKWITYTFSIERKEKRNAIQTIFITEDKNTK